MEEIVKEKSCRSSTFSYFQIILTLCNLVKFTLITEKKINIKYKNTSIMKQTQKENKTLLSQFLLMTYIYVLSPSGTSDKWIA